MKKSVYIFSIAFMFLMCLGSAQKTSACECFSLPPVYEAFEMADAVFIGKVVGSNEPKEGDESYDGYPIVFDLEVIENFKGAEGKTVKVNLGSKSNMCYGGYEVGRTFLVYARGGNGLPANKPDRAEKPKIFYDGFCTMTDFVENARAKLFFIREKLKGKPQPQIYGVVKRWESDLISEKWRTIYDEKIKIVAESDKHRFETFTDRMGIFTFNNIPPGDYTLKPVGGERFRVEFPTEEKFQILRKDLIYVYGAGNYGGFYAEFILDWNNRLDGRVIDSDGKPFKRYVFELIPLSKIKDEKLPFKKEDDYHTDGIFRYGGITPGKYVISVVLYTKVKDSVEKRRFFYPQTESIGEAKIFEFGETTKLTGLEIKLPVKNTDK